jgi:DNA-binding GntR family transcriptional regulator
MCLDKEVPPAIGGGHRMRFEGFSVVNALVDEPPEFEPVSKDSLSRLAYQQVRASLMRSRLRPGQRLVLRQLAAQLGISPTPVREALLRLVSEQGLELDARGTVVVPTMDAARYIEVRDLRIMLEGRSAALAATLAAPEDITALEQTHRRFAEADEQGDAAGALEYNEEFHFALCKLGESPVLFHLVQQLWMLCGPVLTHFYAKGSLGDFENHPQLHVIDALRARDAKAAQRAISLDINRGAPPVLARL